MQPNIQQKRVVGGQWGGGLWGLSPFKYLIVTKGDHLLITILIQQLCNCSVHKTIS